MTLPHMEIRVAGYSPHNRYSAILLYGSHQLALVPATGNIVEDYGSNIDIWLETLVSGYHCRYTACHTGRVDNQDNWNLQETCQVGCAPPPLRIQTVIEPHSSLDESEIGSLASLLERGQHCLLGHQEEIKAATASACCS